jgi:hypothetical protein
MRFYELFETGFPNIIDNPNFAKWFSGSKVVDSAGNPKIMFHGTLQDFKEFKLESEKRRAYGINRLGFWFDAHYDTPNYFAHGDVLVGGGSRLKPNVIVAYLSIKKPIIFNSEPVWGADQKILDKHIANNDYRKFNQHVDAMGRQDSYNHMFAEIIKRLPSGIKAPPVPNGFYGGKIFEKAVEDYKAELISEGYDGIYHLCARKPTPL